MRITSQLGVVAIGTIVTVAVLVPIIVLTLVEFNDAKHDEVLADAIKSNFFERSTIRDQYFLHREDRLVDEWDKSKKVADNLLRQADGLVHRKVDRDNLEQLRRSIEENAVIFHRIDSNYKLLATKNSSHREIYEELDKRLCSQLLLKAGNFRDSAFALQDSAQRRAEQAYLRLSITVGLFAVVLAISVILISINLIRIVNKRLIPLHDGAKKVVSGDLTYQIPSEGSDEFAELAQSFNTMSAKLNEEISAHIQIEKKLKTSETQLANAQTLAKIGNWHVVFGIDESHDLWTVSNGLRQIWGLPPDNGITAHSGFSDMPPEDQLMTRRIWESAKRGQGPTEWEHRIIVNGNIKWMHVVAKFIFDSHGIPLEASGTNQDVTERKISEARLRTLSAAIEQSPVSVVIADLEANIQYVNPRFTEVTGYTAEEAIGQNPRILQSGLTSKETHLELWDKVVNGQFWHGELINKRKNGEIYWEDAHIAPVRDSFGVITHYVATKVDITDRKSMEEKVLHLAQYDVLTDLPNRSLFSDRLQQALAIAKRDKTRLALIFIDLDKFKPVNDEFGHQMGDFLLKAAAERMLECVRESDTVARLGGDEFVVLLPTIEAEQDALLVAEKIRHALNQPFELMCNHLNISSSSGIVVYPEHGTHEAELVKNADVAMYFAKAGGRNAAILFNVTML